MRFPLLPDASGRLGYSAGEDNVEQSLVLLLQTQLGERVMRYDFGCRIPELVFAPGSIRYLRLMEQTIQDAVRDHEPRVTLDEVRAELDPADETSVTVSVTYRVRRSNVRRNLVFPYYLGMVQAR